MSEIRLYCLCGATLVGTLAPTSQAAWTIGRWHRDHSGDGHGAATPVQAQAARRKAEREAAP